MNLFHPIKSPFDFSHDNGYFHTEHLAFLITKQTTTLQGNHFKVIITRLSSPINPITMTQPRKNTIWARGSSLLQTVSSKQVTSSLFFPQSSIWSCSIWALWLKRFLVIPKSSELRLNRRCSRASCGTRSSTAPPPLKAGCPEMAGTTLDLLNKVPELDLPLLLHKMQLPLSYNQKPFITG